MESTHRQRWARVPPHLAWKRPGLPTEWTRVLERNLEGMTPSRCPAASGSTLQGKCCMLRRHGWSSGTNRRPGRPQTEPMPLAALRA
jgi:hypothetical protein